MPKCEKLPPVLTFITINFCYFLNVFKIGVVLTKKKKPSYVIRLYINIRRYLQKLSQVRTQQHIGT